MLLSTIFNIYNRNYYAKDEGWKFYAGYNILRSRIIDYPEFAYNDSTSKVYEEVGWSENDTRMFRSWFFNDLELYSKENLQYVIDNINVVKAGSNLKKTFSGIYRHIYKNILAFIIISTICILYLIVRKRNYYILSIFLPSTAAVLYFAYVGRLPFRVLFPILFFLIIMSFYFTESTGLERFKNKRYFKLAFILVCIALVIFNYSYTAILTRVNKERQLVYEEFIRDMADEEKIYVSWGATGLHDKTLSFKVRNRSNLKVIGQGWSIHNPAYNKRLEIFSIKNIYLDIIERDDIFLIAYGQQTELYKKFMSEHYGEDVKIEKIRDFAGGYSVYKFYIKPYSQSRLLRQAYFYSTGENIEREQLEIYLKELNEGKNTLSNLLIDIMNAKESKLANLNDRDFINLLYEILLGREPDESGFGVWDKNLKDGGTRTDVIKGFLDSIEFKNKYKQ